MYFRLYCSLHKTMLGTFPIRHCRAMGQWSCRISNYVQANWPLINLPMGQIAQVPFTDHLDCPVIVPGTPLWQTQRAFVTIRQFCLSGMVPRSHWGRQWDISAQKFHDSKYVLIIFIAISGSQDCLTETWQTKNHLNFSVKCSAMPTLFPKSCAFTYFHQVFIYTLGSIGQAA